MPNILAFNFPPVDYSCSLSLDNGELLTLFLNYYHLFFIICIVTCVNKM